MNHDENAEHDLITWLDKKQVGDAWHTKAQFDAYYLYS